jgi:uncharacterized membrane protein (DUF4010 family)
MEFLMAKILCMVGMAISALIFLVFLIDLAAGFPFSRYSILLDVCFLGIAVMLAWMGWKTYKEQQ